MCIMVIATLAAAERRGELSAVVDGDTLAVALDGQRRSVRLLYLDAPTATDNAADAPLIAGAGARERLANLLPIGSQVILWTPATDFARDAEDRLLALVTCRPPGGQPEIVQEVLVREGWSPYWGGHGAAPDPIHDILIGAHESARLRGVGLWTQHRSWMDAAFIGHHAAATGSVADRNPAAATPATTTGTHWLNLSSDTRHNRGCRWFHNTKEGRACGPTEGQACRECGG